MSPMAAAAAATSNAASHQQCNGGTTNNQETVRLTVTYPSAGIFGWKKRALYLLLILLMSVVVINMALTFWIIKILDLTSEGTGRMRVTKSGIRVDSDAEFLDTLSAKQIVSRQTRSVRLESSRNVTVFAKDRRNRVTNILSLGESGFQSIGNSFSVRDRNGKVLLHVDPREMVIASNHMTVAESGGLKLDEFLQTSLVRGGATKDLKLDSPLKRVNVKSESNLNLESPAGGIGILSLNDIKLSSSKEAVSIDGTRLEMKNLQTSWAFARKSKYEPIYQVCMCENGRIFLAQREGYCQIQDSFCKGRPNKADEPSWSKPRMS